MRELMVDGNLNKLNLTGTKDESRYLSDITSTFLLKNETMILSDPLIFALSLLDTGSVLFLLVYFIITLSDLECDYLNAQECCSRLNQWTLPKLIAHGFLSFLFLVHGHWLLAIFNMPMFIWMLYEVATVPSGNLGIYDPTEIHNRGQLKKHMTHCMIYLGYYLLFFFAYLYCMIVSLLKGDPIQRDSDYDLE